MSFATVYSRARVGIDAPLVIIEVHISNVHKREEFRKKSFLSDISDGVIVGCGTSGYEYALLEAIKRIEV